MLNGGQNQLVCIKAVGAEEKADLGQVEGVDLVVVEPVHLHDLHLAEVPLNADREVVHLSVLHAKAFPLKNKDKITQGTERGLTVQEEGDSRARRQDYKAQTLRGTHLLCWVTAMLSTHRKWLQVVQKKVKVPCQDRLTMEGAPKLEVEETRNLGEVPWVK